MFFYIKFEKNFQNGIENKSHKRLNHELEQRENLGRFLKVLEFSSLLLKSTTEEFPINILPAFITEPFLKSLYNYNIQGFEFLF